VGYLTSIQIRHQSGVGGHLDSDLRGRFRERLGRRFGRQIMGTKCRPRTRRSREPLRIPGRLRGKATVFCVVLLTVGAL
jgi:hypothetical protein